ncbi:hypothetical protein MRX96_038098 [Rhipicephalus microplus]
MEAWNGYDGVLTPDACAEDAKAKRQRKADDPEVESFLCVRRSSNLKRSSQERYLYFPQEGKSTRSLRRHTLEIGTCNIDEGVYSFRFEDAERLGQAISPGKFGPSIMSLDKAEINEAGFSESL